MVFKGNFGGVFHLFGGAAQNGGKACGAHRGGGADLGLTAAFGPADGGVVFAQATDGSGGEQEIPEPRAGRTGDVIEPIADDGGHDTRRAIGGGGDDLAPGGVFFVHGHGIKRHPVVDRVGGGHVQAAFGHQGVVDAFGPPAYLEAAGQDTVTFHAARDAVIHDGPEVVDPGVDLGCGADGEFIGAFHRGDGKAGGACHAQHALGGVEGVGDGGEGLVLLVGHVGEFSGGQNKATADGIVGFRQDDIALGIGGAQDQAVGMAGQGGAEIEGEVGAGIKLQGGQAGGVNGFRIADRGEGGFCFLRVIGIGQETCEAEDGGTVGGVADAGKGKRAVERGFEALWMKRAGAQGIKEASGGDHRAHGVAGRGADTDLEHIEDGQEHGLALVFGVGVKMWAKPFGLCGGEGGGALFQTEQHGAQGGVIGQRKMRGIARTAVLQPADQHADVMAKDRRVIDGGPCG